MIPNAVGATLTGHQGNVKCIEFIGEEGKRIVSGSSDNTLRIWDTESAQCLDILHGHRSRIWDLSTTRQGEFVASASGDSTVKIWNLKNTKATCATTLNGHAGDVYSIRYHPNEVHSYSSKLSNCKQLTTIFFSHYNLEPFSHWRI